MSDRLNDLIQAGRVDEAILLALDHRTDWVQTQLVRDEKNDNAELVSEFLQRWLGALLPLERLQAANWVVSEYGLSLVYLENAARIGAQLYLGAQAAAAASLASSMRHVEGFSEGPDAALHPSVPQRLYGYADRLDAMSFEFVPFEPED